MIFWGSGEIDVVAESEATGGSEVPGEAKSWRCLEPAGKDQKMALESVKKM